MALKAACTAALDAWRVVDFGGEALPASRVAGAGPASAGFAEEEEEEEEEAADGEDRPAGEAPRSSAPDAAWVLRDRRGGATGEAAGDEAGDARGLAAPELPAMADDPEPAARRPAEAVVVEPAADFTEGSAVVLAAGPLAPLASLPLSLAAVAASLRGDGGVSCCSGMTWVSERRERPGRPPAAARHGSSLLR